MKKTMLLATAVAMFAAPAFAQAVPGPNTNYNDAISTFRVSATVANFCRFGTGDNAAVNTLNSTSTGNAAGGDQDFVVAIQNTANNTVQNASGGFNYAQFQCNTPFNVTYNSTNGGLKASYNGSFDGPFLTTVPYEIQVGSNNNNTAFTPVAQGQQTLISNNIPVAGNGRFRFNIPANPGLLLQGTYSDAIELRMTPVTGVSI